MMKNKRISRDNIVQNWWISDVWVGRCKQIVLHILQRFYLFDDWHLAPINIRPYAREVVCVVQKYINHFEIEAVIEVGCGLGSIIGNIQKPLRRYKRLGIDKDSNVVRAAKILHPSVTFLQGSFDKVRIDGHSCLIMVDFIHRIPEEELKRSISSILLKNEIDLFVFDTFVKNESTEYMYSHRGEYLFGGTYECIRRSKGFAAAHGARRYIEYWEKRQR